MSLEPFSWLAQPKRNLCAAFTFSIQDKTKPAPKVPKRPDGGPCARPVRRMPSTPALLGYQARSKSGWKCATALQFRRHWCQGLHEVSVTLPLTHRSHTAKLERRYPDPSTTANGRPRGVVASSSSRSPPSYRPGRHPFAFFPECVFSSSGFFGHKRQSARSPRRQYADEPPGSILSTCSLPLRPFCHASLPSVVRLPTYCWLIFVHPLVYLGR
ncbi:hypothetical protein MAPG_11126 [Magnaporthiopsis poae ATCC 64411]|uniref:Uncharacterized protein n=1 Tax=Magnaporthiopsis poae (strain ATCC 64411 / 73-15) TaxID=644358 RepID=A0A0C4EEF3_MAGP6|nr:hypothetical protein MAPG_11126 [Magnaporthiopsis poae ATCC 64411]